MAGPMYRQIAEDLRDKILSGELAEEFRRKVEAGDLAGNPDEPRLPTESELMEQWTASRNTVRDAMRLLAGWGLVETRHGKGTYLIQRINPLIITISDADTGGSGEVDVLVSAGLERRKARATSVRVEIHGAADSPKSAAALHLATGESAISRHQKRYVDDIPWSMQTSFYPKSLVDLGASQLLQVEDIEGGTMAYLKTALGIEQTGWRDTIAVRPPESAETTFFRLPADGRVSIIETARTAYDQQGRPVRVTVTVYPADRNQFVAYYGDVPESVRSGE